MKIILPLALALLSVAACSSNDAPSPSYVPPASTSSSSGSVYGLRVGASCTERGVVRCSSDKKGEGIQCDGTAYVPYFSCPGLADCVEIEGYGGVGCGLARERDSITFYSKKADPCPSANARACSFERAVVLACVDGVWSESVHCPPSECTVMKGAVQCANGGVSEGDSCRVATAGSVICSTDLKKILACTNGKAVAHQDCGTGRCLLVDDNTIACR